MRVHAPLDDLVAGKTSIRALRILARFPAKEFTGRELARLAGGAPSRVNVELDRFRAAGLVSRKLAGKTHVWRANPEHEVFRMLERMFERERALPGGLEAALAKGVDDERVTRAVLFGSFARGDEGPESDVDLLVLTKRASDVEGVKDRLWDLAEVIQARFGLQVSPMVLAESELPRLRKTALHANIAAEGRAIKGTLP